VASVIYDVSLHTTNLLAVRRDPTITRATVSAVQFRPRLLRGGQYIGIYALNPRNDVTKMGDVTPKMLAVCGWQKQPVENRLAQQTL